MLGSYTVKTNRIYCRARCAVTQKLDALCIALKLSLEPVWIPRSSETSKPQPEIRDLKASTSNPRTQGHVKTRSPTDTKVCRAGDAEIAKKSDMENAMMLLLRCCATGALHSCTLHNPEVLRVFLLKALGIVDANAVSWLGWPFHKPSPIDHMISYLCDHF